MGTDTVIGPSEHMATAERSPAACSLPVFEQTDERRLRLTFVLSQDPFPPRSGRAVRAISLARSARRAGLDVSFEVVNAGRSGHRIEDGFRVHSTEGPPSWRNPISLYEAFNPPASVARLAEDPPDVALLTDSRAAPTAMLLGALGVRVVVDLPCVVEDELRLTGAGMAEQLAIKPVERLIAREPEGIIVASERDREVFTRRHAAHPGRVVVHPSPAWQPPVGPLGELGDAVVWLGSGAGRRCRHALRRLTRSIVPEVLRRRPGTQVILAGPGTRSYARGGNVVALEAVEDVDALLAQARCLIAPLIGDSGSAVKVADALARGVPVVATPDALVGHADLGGRGALMGESDAQLVDHILALLESSERALRIGRDGAMAYRAFRGEKELFGGVLDLLQRARRQWVDPEQKLRSLRELPGDWPVSPQGVRPFLESRPHRFGRLSAGLFGGEKP